MKRLIFIFFAVLTTCTVAPSFASASESNGTITAGYTLTKICKDTTCSTYGNINWKPTINANTSGATAVSITDTGLSGYLWGDEIGWVNLSPTGSGVTINPSTGVLSGYAYANTGGWINFQPTQTAGNPTVGVSINSVGEFVGYAYVSGLNGGWMKFDCSSGSTCIKTDWRPIPYRPVAASTAGTVGGVVGLQFITQPVQPQPPAATSTSSNTTSSTTATSGVDTPQETSSWNNTPKISYPRKGVVNTYPGIENTPQHPPWYPSTEIINTHPVINTSPQSETPQGAIVVSRPQEKLLAYPFVPERLQWRVPLSHLLPKSIQEKTHIAIPDVDGTTIVLTMLAGLFLWKLVELAVLLGSRSFR